MLIDPANEWIGGDRWLLADPFWELRGRRSFDCASGRAVVVLRAPAVLGSAVWASPHRLNGRRLETDGAQEMPQAVPTLSQPGGPSPSLDELSPPEWCTRDSPI